MQSDTNFYQLLKTIITGAEQSVLSRANLARQLHPLLYPEDQMFTTRQAAEELGRSKSTLERWRWLGVGPEYIRDERGRINYAQGALQNFVSKHKSLDEVRDSEHIEAT
jgi:hypothetical protein